MRLIIVMIYVSLTQWNCKKPELVKPFDFSFSINKDTLYPGETLICKNTSNDPYNSYIFENTLFNGSVINDSLVIRIPDTQPTGDFEITFNVYYIENGQLKMLQKSQRIHINIAYGEVVLYHSRPECSAMLFINGIQDKGFSLSCKGINSFPGCNFYSPGLYRLRLPTGRHQLRFQYINEKNSDSRINYSIDIANNKCFGLNLLSF